MGSSTGDAGENPLKTAVVKKVNEPKIVDYCNELLFHEMYKPVVVMKPMVDLRFIYQVMKLKNSIKSCEDFPTKISCKVESHSSSLHER